MGTPSPQVSVILKKIYQKLFSFFGPQHWWPAKTKFEVIVGAMLVQNTNWVNTARAIKNLRDQKLLSIKKLKDIDINRLSSIIRPAGYFRLKAKRLKNFINFLFDEFDGSLGKMAREDDQVLRKKLLSINGVGPETADSILLYAFQKPFFVVDAYTRRIFSRHGLVESKANYDEIQNIFMKALKANSYFYNEYHALLVRLAKDFCRTKPQCSICPLCQIKPIFKKGE